jgi:hypothetical protein
MSAGQLTTNFISENMLHSKHWKFLALLAMYPWYSHETLDTMFTLIRSKNLKSYWITFAKIAIQNLFQETSHIHEKLAPIWSPLRSLMDHPIPMPGAVNDALYIEVRTLINLWILYFNSNMHKCLFFFSNTGDVLRLERYLSKQYVLLSTQTTIQDAVTQLRATERDKYFTFILDMSCHDSPVILKEVKTRILDKVVITDSYFGIPI